MKAFFYLGGRWLLGVIFGFAAVKKILDPAAFATDIDRFHLLPYPAALVLGLYLPWLELICGIGVICRWRERAALLLIAGLSAVFCAALGSAWFRGLDVNCGCFGHSANSSNLPLATARALGLGLLAVVLFSRGSTARNETPTG